MINLLNATNYHIENINTCFVEKLENSIVLNQNVFKCRSIIEK